ncbi:DUF4362 domain-containing protein [Paenibacillus sp. TRM 82003]|nr:DUF4362 domain-containing protein [Paenibacillus sp. TRM 82003]
MRRLLGNLGIIALAGALLAGCGETVPAAGKPLDEGDIVYAGVGPEGAKNIQRFDAFVAVTESGGDDAVRIVRNTTEGNPIFTDLTFREGAYEIFVDATEDAYAAEEDRKRRKVAECDKLEQTDERDSIRHYACGAYTFYIRSV